MAELPKTLERRDTVYMYVFAVTSIKFTLITVYDRMDAAATINFSVRSGEATIRERRLFESGVYSRAASISFRAGTEIQVNYNY